MTRPASITQPPPEQTPIGDDAARAEHVAEILKALAHPLRIRIVALLCAGPMHVNGLAARLRVEQAIVSQHLRILRMRRLVQAHRKDGFAWYGLREMQLESLVRCMEGCEIR